MINMVENIKEMYAALEAESISKTAKGEKASKIRKFMSDTVQIVKKPKLHLATMFKLAQQTIGLSPNDRSQFTTIVKSMYETTKDDKSNTWIEVTKLKTQE